MGGHEARSYWEHVGLARLIAAMLLPVAAWFIDLQVSYALVKWACAHETRAALLIPPLAGLAIVGVSAWLAWACLGLLSRARIEGGSQEDRSYFLALAGLGVSAFSGLLFLTSLIPRLLLNPCE